MYGMASVNVDAFENQKLELRRGCLVVAVLAALRDEQCGYTLRKAMAEQGLAIDEGTLYPLLRRLETQGRDLGKIEPRGWGIDSVRPSEAMGDRHSHVRRAELGDQSAIAKLNQSVYD